MAVRSAGWTCPVPEDACGVAVTAVPLPQAARVSAATTTSAASASVMNARFRNRPSPFMTCPLLLGVGPAPHAAASDLACLWNRLGPQQTPVHRDEVVLLDDLAGPELQDDQHRLIDARSPGDLIGVGALHGSEAAIGRNEIGGARR